MLGLRETWWLDRWLEWIYCFSGQRYCRRCHIHLRLAIAVWFILFPGSLILPLCLPVFFLDSPLGPNFLPRFLVLDSLPSTGVDSSGVSSNRTWLRCAEQCCGGKILRRNSWKRNKCCLYADRLIYGQVLPSVNSVIFFGHLPSQCLKSRSWSDLCVGWQRWSAEVKVEILVEGPGGWWNFRK